MIIRLNKQTLLFLSMLLITVSNSQFCVNYGFDRMAQYAGLMILLISIYWHNLVFECKHVLFTLLAVLVFFSVGLMMQNMLPGDKIRLLLSMFILASIAVMPCGYIKSMDSVRHISNGIMAGSVINTILALCTGVRLTTLASEGILVKYGFNGGFEHRNYFAYAIMCVFISNYMLYKNSYTYSRKWIILSVFVIVLTNSRSIYILLFAFMVLVNFDRIRVSKYKRSLYLLIGFIIVLSVGIPTYQYLVRVSENFSFRTNGLNNYINFYKNDWFHLIFGSAEMAFRNTGMRYDENIRSVIGWDGSTELVILNILIKNGLLGFIGYFFIFKLYFTEFKLLTQPKVRTILYATLITFLISALVESFVANINHVYTIYCYLFLRNGGSFEERNKSELSINI